MAGQTFNLGEAVLATRVDLSGIQQGVSQAESISRSGMQGAANAGLGIFQTAFAVGLGNLIAQGLSAIASSIHGVFSTMIGEAAEAQRGQAQLAAVIQSTGGVAGITAEKANELASAIQRTTPISDDAVIAGEHMLLTFTNIGSKIFPDATKAMVDMATSMNNGMTPSSEQLSKTAIMLGKALNDPITGASALRKVGVTLSEQQMESIKHFMAVGDAASAQGVILQELQKEFGGSAEAAGKTFSGSLDMLKNKFLEVAENAGGRLLPSLQKLNETLMRPEVEAAVTSLANALADVLAGAIDFLSTTVIPGLIAAWEFIAPAVEGGLQIFRDIATEVFAWGENIGAQFGAGIQAAIGYVIDAINSIGSVITSLLQPGSPPRLLPDLDTWGTGAVNAYMSGWDKGDFSVFNDLSSAIQSHVESIAKALGDKHIDIATLMIGEQGALANAINEIDTVGEVSEEAFQKIIDAAGPAGRDITGLVRSYLDLRRATNEVERAQAELNQVTQEYSEKLAPLQANLKAIQDRKQELQDTQRLADLQEILADGTKDATEKAIAQAEIDEINAKRQIRAVEDERDAAVDSAKAKVAAAKQTEAAAKAQADQQKQLLDVNNKQNALIAEQVKAMDSAAKAMGSAAGAVKAHAVQQDQLGQTVGRVADTVNTATQRVTEIGTTIRTALAPAVAVGEAAFRGLQTIVQTVSNALAPLVTGSFNAITSVIDSRGAQIVGTVTTHWNTIYSTITGILNATWNVISAVLGVVSNLINDHGAEILGSIVDTWSQIYSTIDKIITSVSSIVTTILNNLASFIQSHDAQIEGQTNTTWQRIVSIVQTAIGIVNATIVPALQFIASFIAAHGTEIQTIIGNTWNAIVAIIDAALSLIQGVLQAVLQAINGDWQGALTTLYQTGQQIWNDILILIGSVLDTILTLFGTNLNNVKIAWQTFWNDLNTQATTILNTIVGFISGKVLEIVTFFTTTRDDITKAWNELPATMLGIGADIVNGIIDGISREWERFKNWLRDKINEIPAPVRQALGISSPSQVFAEIGRQMIEGLLAGLQEMLPSVDESILGDLAETMGKIFETLNSAIGAFVSLSGWQGVSMQAIADFIAVTNYLVAAITQIAAAYSEKALNAASEFAQTAGEVLDLIGSGVDALNRINDLTPISSAALQTFEMDMYLILLSLSHVAVALGNYYLQVADQLTTTIGDVLDMLGKGLDSLNSLADVTDIPQQSIDIFASDIQRLLVALAGVALQFQDEAILAATLFTDSAGQVLDLVGTGVDNLAKLASFSGVSATSIAAFVESIRLIVTGVVAVAGSVSSDGLDAAVAFSDGAWLIVTMIGESLDVLAGLAAFGGITAGRITLFAVAIGTLVQQIVDVARAIGQNALAAAVAFANATGRVFDTIRTALEVLGQLADFTAPTVTAISLFAIALDNVIAYLARMAIGFDTDAIRAAQTFARAVGDVITLIGTAVTALAGLEDFRTIPGAAIYAFAVALETAIYYLASIALSWDTKAVAAAAAFADAAGKVVGVISAGVDGFLKLIGFRGVPAVAMAAFGAALGQAINLIGTMASQWSTEAIARASAFADAVSSVVSLIGSGAQAFTDLAALGPVAPAAFQAFSSSMSQTLTMMTTLAGQWSIGAIDQATAFARAVGTIIDLVKAAVDTFSALKDFSDNAPSILDTFIATINTLLARFVAVVVPPATNIGRSIMQAIASAITANAALVTQALLAALEAAFAAATAYLQISSPSLLAQEQLGRPIAEGMAAGIQKYGGLMGPALAGISGNALGTTMNEINNWNLNANYPYQKETSLRDDVVLLSMLKGGRRG